jgi:DNA recombination protein Rad52
MTITSTAPAAAQAPAPSCALPAKRPPTALELIRQADAADHPATQTLTPIPASALVGVTFTAEQRAALAAPLDRAHVRQREQGRGSVSYLEGWQMIAEANRIFGFDGWQRQTLFSHCVAQNERRIGRDQKPGWGVTYIARVRVTVGPLVREGTGAGHGIDVDLGQAHESAIKEAETDAMKRALMTFGNPFGLALYDKRQRQVSDTAAPAPPPAQEQRKPAEIVRRLAPAPAATATAQPPVKEPAGGAAPLDPPTIRGLQERIRALLPPQLEAFRRAFRAAFQVPEEIPSIAGLITEQRHRQWIQQYLSQIQGQPQARPA